MAIDYTGYSSSYGGGASHQAMEGVGRGLSKLIGSIPTKEEKFNNFENTFFNNKFGGIDGQWLMDEDGGISFSAMTLNPDYDPLDEASSMYTIGDFSPLDRNKDYRSYQSQALDEFGEKKLGKMGGIDPIRFGKKYDQLEKAQAIKIAQSLKQLKYSNPEKWDNDKIYESLQTSKNLPIYNLLQKHGLLAMDPDLSMIQKDARFSDYIPEDPWNSYVDNLTSDKIKSWPTKVLSLLSGLGITYAGGKLYLKKTGQEIKDVGFIKNMLKSRFGRVIKAGLAGAGVYLGLPAAARAVTEKVFRGDEKAQNLAGATTEMTLSGIWTATNIIGRKKGKWWLTRKLMNKLGKGFMMKFIAKSGLSGLGAGATGGVSLLLSAGFLASDIYAVYKAIQDIAREENINI